MTTRGHNTPWRTTPTPRHPAPPPPRVPRTAPRSSTWWKPHWCPLVARPRLISAQNPFSRKLAKFQLWASQHRTKCLHRFRPTGLVPPSEWGSTASSISKVAGRSHPSHREREDKKVSGMSPKIRVWPNLVASDGYATRLLRCAARPQVPSLPCEHWRADCGGGTWTNRTKISPNIGPIFAQIATFDGSHAYLETLEKRSYGISGSPWWWARRALKPHGQTRRGSRVGRVATRWA